MRILYLGLPLGALCLHRAGFPPVACALAPLDLPGRRRARRALGPAGTLLLGRPDLSSPEVRRALASARPDCLLSWFWPRRIPPAILEDAPAGAFGVHPSLLPRWRGPDPYFWAIQAGDRETGVTLHRLEGRYDTGPVVEQRRIPVADTDDAWTLARKLDRPALALLLSCARRLAAGEALAGTPQDEAGATEAPAPDDASLSLDFGRTVPELLRLVRAAAPEPGALARLGDHTVEVREARPYAGTLPAALVPGEALRTPEGLAVRAADGAVLLSRVRAEDGAELTGAVLGALVGDQP